MALVPKIDPNKIFASNAPTQDKPAAFDNYEKGMDETRKNNGRPTIPQLNYLHQTADQKILWIHQNGGGLPYDASIEYAENAVTLKDGELKQLVDGAWVEVKTKSLPATSITTASAQNQQQINDFGGAKWHAKVGGYELGATVKLENGDTVKSTVPDNTVNPNIDMTGWKFNDNTVESIADLIAIKNPKDGQVVYVKSHYLGLSLGSGIYQFEQLSLKTPNGGAWISGIGGVWVLTSDLHFENFGVTDEDSDQSDKLQACIDFAQSQNIISYGFEKSFKCRIDKEIVFKAVPRPDDWGMPEDRTEIRMNGSMLVSPINNLTYIRILRDRVEFTDTLAIDGKGSTDQVGIALGYEKTDDPMDASVRRSACFMVLNGYFPANIDIGIKSNIPRSMNGGAYGMYNHKIINYDARHVNIGWYADKGFADDPVTNKLTRTRVFGFGHIDGSCSFYMLACESFKCYGYSGEHLKRDDPRLPDGKAVAWYSPEKANPIDTYQNSYNHVSGFIELAYREYVNYSPYFTWDVQQWFTELEPSIAKVGEAELSLSKMGIGSNGNLYDNKSLTDFHFRNGGYRTAVVSISASSPANASLPAFYAGKDFYGSAQWIPCANNFEDIGLLILTDVFNTEGHRKFINQYSNGSWHGWGDFEYSYGIGRHSNFITNTSLNDFKFNDGGIRYAQVSITGDDPTSAASTPNGNYLYGAIQWIQTSSTEGKQIAWGAAPNTNSQRVYVGGSWSSWADL